MRSPDDTELVPAGYSDELAILQGYLILQGTAKHRTGKQKEQQCKAASQTNISVKFSLV